MLHGERFMWHAHLSSSLNLGLLHPLDAAEAAQRAYREGHAPISAVEGFVRQVIGWREYVWGMYWLHASDWRSMNALRARAPARVPVERRHRDALRSRLGGRPRETAYAHHIVRLMVFGNLMLLRGVAPREAFDWFHHTFIDGFEWVMGPNAVGMATYGDGGRMMTKPYAASGRYIDRMSDFCGDCRYDPAKRDGDDACPFTRGYWEFLERDEERLGAQAHAAAVPQPGPDQKPLSARDAAAASRSWTKRTTIAPSPTAVAQRLTEPERTSPAA